jgi:hypothetical protein
VVAGNLWTVCHQGYINSLIPRCCAFQAWNCPHFGCRIMHHKKCILIVCNFWVWELRSPSNTASAGMISGARRRTKNGTPEAFATSEASPLFRLSATMVELSLRHIQPDSYTDIPAKLSMNVESCPTEVRGQVGKGMAGTTEEEGSKAAQLPHGGSAQARQELLGTSISRISDQGVKIFPWLRTRTGIATLALLAFTGVYAFRHQSDSVKNQSQIPAIIQHPERPLVPSITPRNTHNHAQTMAPKKAKSRRHSSDYIAKDTYIYLLRKRRQAESLIE